MHGERDPAAAAIFAAGWKHKISTILQWGNAQQRMSVAKGEGATMSRERSHMIAMDIYTNKVDWRMLLLLLGRYRRGEIGGRQGDREIMPGRNRAIIRGQGGTKRIIFIDHK